MKCNTCLNSRPAISENGVHFVCCLSAQAAKKCIFDGKRYIKNPMPTVEAVLTRMEEEAADEK